MKLGDVTLVKDCLICEREVILVARRNKNCELPEKGSFLPQVCRTCATRYLTKGTLFFSDDGRRFVIKDIAVKKIFNKEPPENKIARIPNNVMSDLINNIVKE